MNTLAPIKRENALRSFSREHHHGLLLSWKIRKGMKNNIDTERIWRYVDWFWNNLLSKHFKLENELLFSKLPSEDKTTEKLHTQRRRIQRLFEKKPKNVQTLSAIDEELERLIRFEERVILNQLQEILSPTELEQLETLTLPQFQENWEDEFWLVD